MRCFDNQSANVQSPHIDSNNRIGQIVVILPGGKIGAVQHMGHVFIENDVINGDRVTA